MTSSNDSDFCFQGIEKPKYDNNPAILNNFNNNIEEEDSLDFEEKYVKTNFNFLFLRNKL